MPDKYKPKKLNPHPQYFITVKGFIDPRLVKHIHLTMVAEYNNYNPKCNMWVSRFNGVDGPWQIFHDFPVHINKQGYYYSHVPLDYYQPGKCDWHAATVRYKVGNEGSEDANVLAFFDNKIAANPKNSSGGAAFNCSYGYPSCETESVSGFAKVNQGISYRQQVIYHLDFYYKKGRIW